MAVALAEEGAIRTQARANEPRVLDENALKAKDLVQCEGILACLEDGAPPSLEPVARRPFAFDLKTGAAVSQQEDARSAGNEMCASPPECLAHSCGEIKGDGIFQVLGSANDWTEARRPKQIIAYTMSARRTRFAGEIGFRIENVDDCRARRVVNVNCTSGQELVQVPRAAHLHGCRIGPHQGLKLYRRNSVEHALQDQEVEVLMTKGKEEVVCEIFTRPITLVEDGPAAFFATAVTDILFGDAALDRAPERRFRVPEQKPTSLPTGSPAALISPGRPQAMQYPVSYVEKAKQPSKTSVILGSSSKNSVAD